MNERMSQQDRRLALLEAQMKNIVQGAKIAAGLTCEGSGGEEEEEEEERY